MDILQIFINILPTHPYLFFCDPTKCPSETPRWKHVCACYSAQPLSELDAHWRLPAVHPRCATLARIFPPPRPRAPEQPSRRFAPLAPCPHRAAKCKGKCLCLLQIPHTPASRAETWGETCPLVHCAIQHGKACSVTNERAEKGFLGGKKKGKSWLGAFAERRLGSCCDTELCAPFGHLRYCVAVQCSHAARTCLQMV